MGFFKKIGNFLGDAVGAVAPLAGLSGNPLLGLGATVLGSALDRKKDQYTRQDAWKHAQGMGLTPQEFMGSPMAGGQGTSAAAQTLGNSYGQRMLQAEQQKFESQERALDRQKDIAVAETNASAQLGAANINITPLMDQVPTLNRQREAEIEATLARIGIDVASFDKQTANDLVYLTYRAQMEYDRFEEVSPNTQQMIIANMGVRAGEALLSKMFGIVGKRVDGKVNSAGKRRGGR